MSNPTQNKQLSLTLDDLKSFTHFGRWIERHFGQAIKLADLDGEDIERAIDGIISSPQFSAMPKEDKARFVHALNALTPNLDKIRELSDD